MDSYKIWQLAVEVLDDFDGVDADVTQELTRCIQDAIEGWITDARLRLVIRGAD